MCLTQYLFDGIMFLQNIVLKTFDKNQFEICEFLPLISCHVLAQSEHFIHGAGVMIYGLFGCLSLNPLFGKEGKGREGLGGVQRWGPFIWVKRLKIGEANIIIMRQSNMSLFHYLSLNQSQIG